ncbi:MAG: hypothetical protein ACE5IQ_13790, partial [Candidatus Methylomirabilales bacterium]
DRRLRKAEVAGSNPAGSIIETLNKRGVHVLHMPELTAGNLIEDEDIRRWYENLARNSTLTAQVRLRVLARFCRKVGITPQEIVTAVKQRRKSFEDSLMDFLQAERDRGRAPSYLRNYLKAVRSWLDHHGLEIRRGIKVGKSTTTPTLNNEQIPTREQLRDLVLAASPRGRVIIAFMAFSGLRPGVLGDAQGTDGLCLGDLPELIVEKGRVSFDKIPAVVRVRTELSKMAHEYLTFLSEEGCDHLQRYLQARLNQGEELPPEAPAIRCALGFETMGKRATSVNYGSPFIVTGKITQDVRSAMDKCNWQARPYVLRRYFETQLLTASWEGGPNRDWVSFWAGHRGDIEHVYTLHKGLPEPMIEKMRAAYRGAESFLSTVSLTPEGRKVAAVSISGEEYSLAIPVTNPRLAHKSDEEKLLAFMVKAVRENDLLKTALKQVLTD